MNIQNDKSIGSKVYFLKQIKKMTCPLCEGEGKIMLGKKVALTGDTKDEIVESLIDQVTSNIFDAAIGNMTEYTCPECNGKGSVKMTSPKYEVGDGEVVAIRADENADGVQLVFSVKDGCCVRKLSDQDTWITHESAQKRCDFMNLERRLVPIECIQIPQSFAKTIPCNEKLMRRLDEWRKAHKFETEIFVDEKLNLFDGYTSFLMYRMLGKNDVPVVIWPDEKRP